MATGIRLLQGRRCGGRRLGSRLLHGALLPPVHELNRSMGFAPVLPGFLHPHAVVALPQQYCAFCS
jgi:hypothetical protein